MAKLVRYCLAQFFGETVEGDVEVAERLLGHVVRGAARLAASYMTAGFVHGVLNSDNINITAESFDYGPWRFAPRWEAGFTAAYFDHHGLYAFGRQPQAIHWDVAQLAIALTQIAPAEALAAALDGFPTAYEGALRRAMLARLGVASRGERDDLALVGTIEEALEASGAPIDRFFFDWRGGRRRESASEDARYDAPEFAGFREAVALFGPVAGATGHDYWRDVEPCAMLIDEVEAIWAAIDMHDDWAPFEAKIAAIRRMGAAMAAGRAT